MLYITFTAGLFWPSQQRAVDPTNHRPGTQFGDEVSIIQAFGMAFPHRRFLTLFTRRANPHSESTTKSQWIRVNRSLPGPTSAAVTTGFSEWRSCSGAAKFLHGFGMFVVAPVADGASPD